MRTIKVFTRIFELLLKLWELVEKAIRKGNTDAAIEKAKTNNDTRDIESIINRDPN